VKRFAVALALAAAVAAPAAAQDPKAVKPKDFPTQPIEYVVVYPAGGGMDVTARLLAKYVEKATGDKILVNNRTGGAGVVGHTYLATQAKPDGYTVGVLANLVWGDAMLRSQGKWAYTDLEPIGYLNTDALTWVGPTEGPLKGKSLKEIVQIAKDKPGTIRIATVPGTMWEYLVEQVEAATGAKFLRVPFQGGGAGINALAGGSVDIGQGFFSEFRGLQEAGKVTPLAVASPERMPYLKDMPTFNEALGGKDYIWAVIRFVVVPKGTPAFDPALMSSTRLADDLNQYAEREKAFYQQTGRLK
jgi:tripartite-type tricarboxylate transporter receptor subunit TctC